jgi:hypothetical protein
MTRAEDIKLGSWLVERRELRVESGELEAEHARETG